MEISPILIPIFAIIGVFSMIILLRKYENDERMAMIDKGLDPNIPKPAISKASAIGTLRFALLAIGVSFGLLIGNFLERNANVEEGVAYPAMILMFGGLGLLGSYFAQLKQEAKAKREKTEKQYMDV